MCSQGPQLPILHTFLFQTLPPSSCPFSFCFTSYLLSCPSSLPSNFFTWSQTHTFDYPRNSISQTWLWIYVFICVYRHFYTHTHTRAHMSSCIKSPPFSWKNKAKQQPIKALLSAQCQLKWWLKWSCLNVRRYEVGINYLLCCSYITIKPNTLITS